MNTFQEPKQTKIRQFLHKSMKGAYDDHEMGANKTFTKKGLIIPDYFNFSGSKQRLAADSKLNHMNGKGKSIAIPTGTHCTCKLH